MQNAFSVRPKLFEEFWDAPCRFGRDLGAVNVTKQIPSDNSGAKTQVDRLVHKHQRIVDSVEQSRIKREARYEEDDRFPFLVLMGEFYRRNKRRMHLGLVPES
jgi:hypothetical protein